MWSSSDGSSQRPDSQYRRKSSARRPQWVVPGRKVSSVALRSSPPERFPLHVLHPGQAPLQCIIAAVPTGAVARIGFSITRPPISHGSGRWDLDALIAPGTFRLLPSSPQWQPWEVWSAFIPSGRNRQTDGGGHVDGRRVHRLLPSSKHGGGALPDEFTGDLLASVNRRAMQCCLMLLSAPAAPIGVRSVAPAAVIYSVSHGSIGACAI